MFACGIPDTIGCPRGDERAEEALHYQCSACIALQHLLNPELHCSPAVPQRWRYNKGTGRSPPKQQSPVESTQRVYGLPQSLHPTPHQNPKPWNLHPEP